MMLHFVGSALEVFLGYSGLVHRSLTVVRKDSMRAADFAVDEMLIHVAVQPTKMLMQRCRGNVAAGYNQAVILPARKIRKADELARATNLEKHLEILDVEQFVTANLYVGGRFRQVSEEARLRALVERYNTIVTSCGEDDALRIEILNSVTSK